MPELAQWLLLTASVLLALQFRPWASLRQRALQHPWLATLVLLPWLWNARHLVPADLGLHFSGACILVLMFGWPLAVLSSLPVAGAAALIQHGLPPADVPAVLRMAAADALWTGIVPATLALGVGSLSRRWLPEHLFVYILGRGFIGTAIAMMATGALEVWLRGTPASTSEADMLIARWLMAWGEAFATGMLAAIFVAFMPQWLLTYSDARYLPSDRS